VINASSVSGRRIGVGEIASGTPQYACGGGAWSAGGKIVDRAPSPLKRDFALRFMPSRTA